MSIPLLIISSAKAVAVGASAADVGASMSPPTQPGSEIWSFVSSTACWIKQGSAKLVTTVAKASLVDADFMTVTIGGKAVVYEFDVAGDGVTAGRVQVNVSTDTTAIQVAARLQTAIAANQATLTIVNPADGTLTLICPGDHRTVTENVAAAGFTITAAVVNATAGAGSMYVPPNIAQLLDSSFGPQLGVIQDAAPGKCSLTRTIQVNK